LPEDLVGGFERHVYPPSAHFGSRDNGADDHFASLRSASHQNGVADAKIFLAGEDAADDELIGVQGGLRRLAGQHGEREGRVILGACVGG